MTRRRNQDASSIIKHFLVGRWETKRVAASLASFFRQLIVCEHLFGSLPPSGPISSSDHVRASSPGEYGLPRSRLHAFQQFFDFPQIAAATFYRESNGSTIFSSISYLSLLPFLIFARYDIQVHRTGQCTVLWETKIDQVVRWKVEY